MRRYLPPTRHPKGFTAIEIAMVASVIAILALLILPLFRSRSEEAKVTAARDELQSLAKALLLTEADTGHFFRTQDLDNGTLIADDPITGVPFVWSGVNPNFPTIIPWVTLNATQRDRLVPPIGNISQTVGTSVWRGPYISFQKSITFEQLRAIQPQLFTDSSPTAPLYVREDGLDDPLDRIPIDPWGSPYLFINLAETNYGPRLLYSMGPNGLPGDNTPPYLYTSYRTGGDLGLGDDLEYIF